MRSHEWIDARSLALHEAIAAKLEADPAVLEVLRSRSDRAARLRQSSPFAGVLTAVERHAIFARYGSRRA